jgi:hypothetical protein
MEQKNIIAALIKAQKQIIPPSKSGTNPMFKSKYATLDDILSAVREALTENDLILTCTVDRDDLGHYALARLIHSSGEYLESKFPMLLEKQTNQGIASARTYAFRYAVCNILALPSEDDDGNAASLPEKKTGPTFKDTVKTPSKVVKGEFLQADEVQQIENLIGSDHDLADRILAGYSQKYKEPIATFYDLRKSDYPALLTRISAMKNPKPIARQA